MLAFFVLALAMAVLDPEQWLPPLIV